MLLVTYKVTDVTKSLAKESDEVDYNAVIQSSASLIKTLETLREVL